MTDHLLALGRDGPEVIFFVNGATDGAQHRFFKFVAPTFPGVDDVQRATYGGLLAAVRDNTKDKIENQQLQVVKGPAIKSIFEGASNDPIADRFKLKDGDIERSFFVAVLDGKP